MDWIGLGAHSVKIYLVWKEQDIHRLVYCYLSLLFDSEFGNHADNNAQDLSAFNDYQKYKW